MIALAEFSYVHSKEKMDLYYSIPVRRKKLFLSGYMTGFLMFVGIFLVCEILAMLVAATKGVSLSLLFLPFLKGSVLAYHRISADLQCSCFCDAFYRQYTDCCLWYGSDRRLYPAVTMIAQAYIETGFYTALKAIQLWKIAYTTPIGIMIWIEQGIQHGTPWFGAKMHDTWRHCCILFGRSLDVYAPQGRMRRYGTGISENRADPEDFDGTSGALAIGIVAYGMTGSNQYSWLFGGFIFGVLVLGMLMEFVYHRDVKLAFAHKIGDRHHTGGWDFADLCPGV